MLLVSFLFALYATATAQHQACSTNSSSLAAKLSVALNGASQQLGAQNTASLEVLVEDHAEKLNTIGSLTCNGDATERARRACQLMSVLFGNRTVDSDSTAYISEEQESWSTTTWLPAACFVQIQSPVEIVAALGVITHVQSKFAVRSRGHNPNPGFSSVDQNGVLLDLRDLSAVNVHEDGMVVSVEPGASWGNVYGFLDSYNRSAVGGRHADVGVVGLLLGGGMPYFAGLTGLPSSNVKAFQIVLANSTVVEATSEVNSDLFYALKGGGPNYGIVTSVDLYTVPLHKVWYSLAVYNVSDAAAVLAGITRLHEFASTDPNLGFFLNVNADGLFAGLLYADWTTWPAACEQFKTIAPVVTLANATNGTIFSLASALSVVDPKMRRYGTSITHRFNPGLYHSTYNSYLEYLSLGEHNNSVNRDLSYTIQPISANVSSLQQRNGGSPLMIEPVDQDWIVVPIAWGSAVDDAKAVGAADSLQSDIKQQAKRSGDLLDLIFMNDAAAKQNPLASYGVDAQRKLKRVARKYDPDATFQKLQYGGFLLDRA